MTESYFTDELKSFRNYFVIANECLSFKTKSDIILNNILKKYKAAAK